MPPRTKYSLSDRFVTKGPSRKAQRNDITAIAGTSLRDPEVRSRIVDGLMSTLPLEASARAQIDHVLTVADANLAAIGIVGAVALIWSASGKIGRAHV